MTVVWTTLIAVLGTLGATVIALVAQANRERGNRAQEDRRRFLAEELAAGADVWAACELIRRRVDEQPDLWTSSVALSEEMNRFASAFARLQLLGNPEVVKAANALFARLEARRSDHRIDSLALGEELVTLRIAVRSSLDMDTPAATLQQKREQENRIMQYEA